MNAKEFRAALKALGINQTEASTLLDVSDRSVRRWAEGPEEIPGPVEQTLRAWVRLEVVGLAWRPDREMIGNDISAELRKQIASYRRLALDLDALLRKVKSRGGPAAPWDVDLQRRIATLGPIEVSFYPLTNGGFSPAHYTRKDCSPDQARDQSLLEDAYACIAESIKHAGKGWSDSNQ